MGKVKYYTPEYKKKAVEMFREIGEDNTLEILGISQHSLHIWSDQEREGKLDYVYMDANKLKQLESKAAKGDKDAQEELCDYYADEGEVSDETRIEWFTKAAKKGWPEAQYRMAYEWYYDNRKIKLTSEEHKAIKFKWYKKAAEQGHVLAQYELADCYYFGDGVEENQKSAFKWYKKAAEQGCSLAQREVGDCYLHGKGVAENHSEAFKWYKKAAEDGLKSAVTMMGYCYYCGFGVPQNERKAVNLFKEAADEGDNFAIYWLGMAYLKGRGVEKDSEEGVYWLKEAARKGSKIAQEQLEKMESACFITTAVCCSFNKPDSCYELTMFRNFRDNWLSKEDNGKSLISEYYKIAPQIVRAIDVRNDAKNIYLGIWKEYLLPCLKYIENKKFEACKEKYVSMVRNLAKKFLS